MNKFSSADLGFMRRALHLARLGRYTTSPNPCVGCVIVKDGLIVGEGWHKKAGTDHAEDAALKNAGYNVSGATVYVTLEPCSHYGRTPPCAKTLVKAGVSRVVAATLDINPKVAGRGFEILKKAGIKTEWGLLSDKAQKINRPFFTAMRTGKPWVMVKTAMSLDARTALADGQSKWITSDKARRDVQGLRARADAIITGVNTVIADNPHLNVRYDELPRKVRNIVSRDMLHQPVKVVLDSNMQLTDDRLADFAMFAEGRNLIVSALDKAPAALLAQGLVQATASVQEQQDSKDKEQKSAPAVLTQEVNEHVTRVYLPRNSEQRVDLTALLRYLGNLEMRCVMVEAGAVLSSAFLSANLCDELFVYMAPKLLGTGSREGFVTPAPALLADAPHFRLDGVKKVGQDIRVHYLKDED